MSLVNPNIALSTRGVELQDPLAQYGRVMAIQQAGNQNALAQYQLGAAQRGEARDIARTNALAGAGSNETAVANALLKSGDIAGYSAFVKAIEDRKTQKLTQQKTQGEISAQPLAMQKAENELFDTSMKQIRNSWGSVRTPEDAMAIHDATHRDPVINKRLQAFGITEQMGRQQILDAARDPASFASFVQKAQLGAEKFMEMNRPTTQVVDQSGQRQVIQIPGLGGTPTTVGTYADVPLPATVEAQKSRIAKSGAPNITIPVSTEKKYGERFGGLIADQDAAKLSAAENAPNAAATADRVMDLISTGKVITGTGANARLQLAKALNLAGGTDSEKIRNTEVLVSSLAETTLGAIKSSNLGAGQGFTNADRDFLEKAKAGQLSYDAKSLTELARLSRLAAEKSADSWNTRVKQIPASALEGTGISSQPVIVPKRSIMKNSGQKGAASTGAPAGVDPNIWQYMTPEERNLWPK
ncbi:hypothetical protein UFOVP372_34 [uncultured Caudovirales phage]|uniref:Uncharacterized protein n=1 Tax=uncultured Caudovirales phage TaxID=2100421 RepID=A0A6J7WXQ4_9CAUD|nr:hypothetical protein UFOVP372_34 [uncultured Caudovirales phage]